MVVLNFNKKEMRISHKRRIFIFSPNCSTQMDVSLPFEGHKVAYQCKGLDQLNIVCEYKVNLSTNENVITEQLTINFNTICQRTMLNIKVI